MRWYYNFLVRRPYLMVVSISVFNVACIIVSLTAKKLPNFDDPTLGFESRGTDIGKRLTSWQNLIQQTGPSGQLVADPKDIRDCDDYLEELNISHRRKGYQRKGNRKKKNKIKQKLDDTLNRKLNKKKNQKDLNNESMPKSPDWTSNQTKTKPIYDSDDDIGVLVGHYALEDNATEDALGNESDSFNGLLRQRYLEWNGDSGVFRDYEITNNSDTASGIWSFPNDQVNRSEHFEYGRNTTSIDEDVNREREQTKKSRWRILKQAAVPPPSTWFVNSDNDPMRDDYFCDSPAKEYSHFVIKRIGTNATDSLFDLNGLLSICQLQDQIASVPSYGEFCQKERLTDNCCRPWSLANYAALFANKSSCFDLMTDDVSRLQNLLVVCFEYFHDLKLSNDCSEYNRCYAPTECKRHNVVFNILHFLTDYNFIKYNSTNIFLKYSMIFVPVAHTTKILPLFHEWEETNLKNDVVQVIGMDLGLENELFNESLLTDSWLVGLGGVFVMACMWLYTASAFLTIMTCTAICFSLGLAYFIYTIVFEMSFFPYMNLLAVVVTIGTGADDAFIFVKIWQCVLAERFTKSSTVTTQSISTIQAENAETFQNLMALTLRHAAISMLVTSLTTAGAFYSSYVSSITAIKCFGVFAGTTVITNYLLMITWLPASVSIMERMSTWKTVNQLQIQKLLLMMNKSINRFCNIFESAVIGAVMRYSILWIFLFSTIGISSMVIVLYWPGLSLPENDHFQLFVDSHPFEVYNAQLRNEFWFEKSMSIYANFKLPLRFVWGIKPADDGDFTNPYVHGNLYYDNNFNISTKSAQKWLLDFCKHLKQQPFYQLTFGLLLPNCFIENFITLMDRMCIDNMDNTDRTPCCDVSKFPYEPNVFELCLPQSISSLYATPREYFIPGVAGPKFYAPHQDFETKCRIFEDNNLSIEISKNSSLAVHSRTAPPAMIKAIVIEFESNVSYTTVYTDVKNFVEIVEKWFANELKSAPNEMQDGWFISELKFFDVQDTLSNSTIAAILVSMTVSFIVMFLATLNVLISFYAILTVLLTIFSVVATLILLGWKLNVLESIILSTAIGLAIDFSLHYGIQYRLSSTADRLASTKFALSRIIGPTAMAALTTAGAGGLMLASSVLPYIQIGIFLVVLMTISWLYATFFLMSILKEVGPQYGYLQFNYPKFTKRSTANGSRFYDRKPSLIVVSEQLLTPSSSAACDLATSETHELESLTSNTNIKTISGHNDFFPQINSDAPSSSPNSTSTAAPPIIDFEHLVKSHNEKLQKQQKAEINFVEAKDNTQIISISNNRCNKKLLKILKNNNEKYDEIDSGSSQ